MKVLMPQLGETVNEGLVATWHKKEGEELAKDDVLLDVETDKVATEITAPIAGTLTRIVVQEGETVDVGTVLAIIGDDDDEPAERPPEKLAQTPARKKSPGPRQAGGDRLSPVVRRLLAQHNLDASQVRGSGDNERITRRDVLAHVAASQGADAPGGSRVPFNRIRRVTADHMVKSKATSPHVLQTMEVDFARVEAVRQARREAWKTEHGFALTYLPFVARAVCLTLAEFPRLNASVDGDGLVLHASVNLSIAIDLNFEGLVAPVIREAGKLSVAELAHVISALGKKAHGNALVADDFSGGTYTLSNPGPFGTYFTAPIINQPQVAILSMDGIKKRPVVVSGPAGDSVAISPVGVLAQSFDHRAVDGAYSAAFLAKLRSVLEQTDWSAVI